MFKGLIAPETTVLHARLLAASHCDTTTTAVCVWRHDVGFRQMNELIYHVTGTKQRSLARLKMVGTVVCRLAHENMLSCFCVISCAVMWK